MFEELRATAKRNFDYLDTCLRDRRSQVEGDIKRMEDAAQTSLAQLEVSRAALTSHASSMELVAESASGAALLGMLANMETRLGELVKQQEGVAHVPHVQLVLDEGKVEAIHAQLAKLGKSGSPTVGDNVRE
jgi:hypothetical protein